MIHSSHENRKLVINIWNIKSVSISHVNKERKYSINRMSIMCHSLECKDICWNFVFFCDFPNKYLIFRNIYRNIFSCQNCDSWYLIFSSGIFLPGPPWLCWCSWARPWSSGDTPRPLSPRSPPEHVQTLSTVLSTVLLRVQSRQQKVMLKVRVSLPGSRPGGRAPTTCWRRPGCCCPSPRSRTAPWSPRWPSPARPAAPPCGPGRRCPAAAGTWPRSGCTPRSREPWSPPAAAGSQHLFHHPRLVFCVVIRKVVVFLISYFIYLPHQLFLHWVLDSWYHQHSNTDGPSSE